MGNREKEKLLFLGIGDLRKRWFFSRQGIHNRRKLDQSFPAAYCYINNGRDAIFLKSDIEDYEKLRPLLKQYGGWEFCQSREERGNYSFKTENGN